MNKFLMVCAMALTLSLGARAEDTDLRVTGQSNGHIFMSLSKPWIEDEEYVHNIMVAVCLSQQVCHAHMWETGDAEPSKLPFSKEEVQSKVASYRKNRAKNVSVMLWNCQRWPEKDAKECLSN